MEKPPEQIRIVKNMLRDLQEKMAMLEIRIDNLGKKIEYYIKKPK